MTTTTQKVWTEEALLALPHDGAKYELINGELHTMSPSFADHGLVCTNIAHLLSAFVRPRKLGVVLDGQAGFYMSNGDLFSPDVSFIRLDRWKSLPRENRHKFFRGSPDLAVEVLSLSEPRRHIDRKIKSYLQNDTSFVWVVDPMSQSVTIHDRSGTQEMHAKDSLAAESLLPGFAAAVASIFADLDDT